MIFEALQLQVPLDQIVAANGPGKAHCVAPNHPDDDPSMHVYDEHVHCFACGYHGDVVDVWASMHGFGHPSEAALDLAREFGIELPEWDSEAQRKAAESREKEDLYSRQAQACHRALCKHTKVREWWENRGFDEELQERFLLGSNKDGTAAIVPFWGRGRVQGLIRRKLEGEPRYLYPRTEEFPRGYRPLFVPGPIRAGAFLVEGIVDALAVTALGESVIAIGGTNPSEHQMRELKSLPGPLYALPDADEDGAEAARRWVREFYPKVLLCPAEYGDVDEGRKDVADLFAAEGEGAKVHLEGLKDRVVDGLELALGNIPKHPSKRRRLQVVRENIIPLLLQEQGKENGPDALLEPTKDSALLATLDDVAAATKLKVSVLKPALEEEAQRRLSGIRNAAVAEQQAEAATDALPEEAYAPLLAPGVLGRYVKVAAQVHGVVGDEASMKLVTLVAIGAQLELLPNGKPLGPSAMLVADSGRGKNYLTDAVVRPLPPEWYLAFESASATSLYYRVAEDPEFLKHRFVYPSEAEGTDMLVAFLRPMLSAGKAVRLTVNNTGANGANEAQELEVRGPITTVIPTVRNKLDGQLQTRLLVAELADYAGRVRKHAQAASKLLLPDYASADYTEDIRAWQAALRSLTEVRRVVFPLGHEGFAFDDDGVSHGARLWSNLLALMCCHAWLEQRNRQIIELTAGGRAIVACPDDYEAAYEVFKNTCQRTVANLSDTHRAILDGLYKLHEDDPGVDGFSQRAIAEQAGIRQGTISKHKAFLATSVKLIKETDHGLALVSGAEPSWWSNDDLMRGFPSPAQVRAWWNEEHPPLDGDPGNTRNHRNTENHAPHGQDPTTHTNQENGSQGDPDGAGIDRNRSRNGDSGLIPEERIIENGLPTPKTGGAEGVIPRIPVISGSAGAENGVPELTAKEVGAEMRRAGSGPALTLQTYLEKPTAEHLERLVKATLNAKSMKTAGWERHVYVVQEAAADPTNHPLDCECEECL